MVHIFLSACDETSIDSDKVLGLLRSKSIYIFLISQWKHVMGTLWKHKQKLNYSPITDSQQV